MTGRSLLVALHRLPEGRGNLADVLRTAVGLSVHHCGHAVTVVLFGEGVMCALKGRNPEWVQRYLKAARAHNVEVFADGASLKRLSLEPDNLLGTVQPMELDDYLARWRETEIHLRV